MRSKAPSLVVIVTYSFLPFLLIETHVGMHDGGVNQ